MSGIPVKVEADKFCSVHDKEEMNNLKTKIVT